MIETSEQSDVRVFENTDPHTSDPTIFYVGAFGLILFAIISFIGAIRMRNGQMTLHLTTTLPTIVAVGLLTRAVSIKKLPKKIVVAPDSLEVTTKKSTTRYPWSEIGSAVTANIINSPKTCLRITNTAGRTVVQVDESFPRYRDLVELVQRYVDAKPDDTALRLAVKKAKRTAVLTFVFGCFLATAAIFITIESRGKQRAAELLSAKGVPGEAEIVRRFTAPNGVTRRIEYRIAGSDATNVEVNEAVWNQLEGAEKVPVFYVPGEPNISRLERGQVIDDDFMSTPLGGTLMSVLGGLMALFVLAYSPFAWMGYDLAYNQEQKQWKVKRYGRDVSVFKKNEVA